METNLNEIREMSKILFNAVPIKETMFGIVQHPYVTSTYSCTEDGEMVNLTEEEDKKKFTERYMEEFDKADLLKLYMLVNSAWKMTWFKYMNEFLNEEDYGHFLENSWVAEENPNADVNVSVKESISYFKKANKKYLMVEEDYKYYNELPEELIVWRGVSPGRVKYGLSWTNDREKAEWFKERFESAKGTKGILLEAKIKKKDVLAYFNTRNEKELVVDVFKIKKNIIEV